MREVRGTTRPSTDDSMARLSGMRRARRLPRHDDQPSGRLPSAWLCGEWAVPCHGPGRGFEAVSVQFVTIGACRYSERLCRAIFGYTRRAGRRNHKVKEKHTVADVFDDQDPFVDPDVLERGGQISPANAVPPSTSPAPPPPPPAPKQSK